MAHIRLLLANVGNRNPSSASSCSFVLSNKSKAAIIVAAFSFYFDLLLPSSLHRPRQLPQQSRRLIPSNARICNALPICQCLSIHQ